MTDTGRRWKWRQVSTTGTRLRAVRTGPNGATRRAGHIHPGPVLGHLRRLRRLERRSHDEQLEVQRERLGRLVTHAAANVPHYRDRFDAGMLARGLGPEDLAGLPVLEREEVNDPSLRLRLLADGFGPDNTASTSTSGSSGVPVTIHNSERDLAYLRATYLGDLLASGLRPTDRIAYFRPGSFLRHPLERFGVLPSFQIDTRANLDDQVDAFLRARPTFLTGFPSTISCVMAELQRRGIDYDRVHQVVFGGERVRPALRASVLDFFGADGSEVYASVEMFTIARSCRLGSLHVRTPDVVVEVEQADGSVLVAAGEGDAIVTRLHGEAMPLIRYRLGDRVRFAETACGCNEAAGPVIAEVLGRRQDLIVGPDDRLTSIDALDTPLVGRPDLAQLQVVQDRPGRLEVRVVLANDAGPGALEQIQAVVADSVPGYDANVVAVDRIEPGPNGKIRTVVSTAAADRFHLKTPTTKALREQE